MATSCSTSETSSSFSLCMFDGSSGIRLTAINPPVSLFIPKYTLPNAPHPINSPWLQLIGLSEATSTSAGRDCSNTFLSSAV